MTRSQKWRPSLGCILARTHGKAVIKDELQCRSKMLVNSVQLDQVHIELDLVTLLQCALDTYWDHSQMNLDSQC